MLVSAFSEKRLECVTRLEAGGDGSNCAMKNLSGWFELKVEHLEEQ